MEYNWEREISPYAAVKEGLSKKVTEASGQRAHGHKQESSSHTHTHTPSFELARLGLPFCKPKCFN